MYNKAIATSNTDIVVNAVIVLFINDIDEWIFAAIEAANRDWTKHTEEDSNADDANSNGDKSDDDDDVEAAKDENDAKLKDEVELLKGQIAALQRQIASQEEELRKTKLTEEEDAEGEKDGRIEESKDENYVEMNEEIVIQKELIAALQRQIASQEEELRRIKEIVITANHPNAHAHTDGLGA